VAVHQVHFDGDDGLPYVGAAAIDDNDDVVVGVVSAFTPGAGTDALPPGNAGTHADGARGSLVARRDRCSSG
jgi:hypothetical protein